MAIQSCKSAGIITYRDFKTDEAKKCMLRWTLNENHMLTVPGFPISLLLIGMIYTSTKAIRYLSIPVYTIFKNLTIILIAYGEVLWFGGSVSPMALLSFGLMVLSSVIAAWADIKHVLESHGTASSAAAQQLATLNSGYIWMLANCLSTAAYILGMRKRIKLTNFKDFDSKCLALNVSTSTVLTFSSHVLQQLVDHSCPPDLFVPRRRLVWVELVQELPSRVQEWNHRSHDIHWSIIHLHLIYLGVVCTSNLFDHLLNGWRTEQAAHCCIRSHLLRCPRHDPQCLGHLCWFRQRYCVRSRKGQRIGEAKDGHPPHIEHPYERKQPEQPG